MDFIDATGRANSCAATPPSKELPLPVGYFFSVVEQLFAAGGPLRDLKLTRMDYDDKTNMITIAVNGSWRQETAARIKSTIDRAVSGHPMADGNKYQIVDESTEELPQMQKPR